MSLRFLNHCLDKGDTIIIIAFFCVGSWILSVPSDHEIYKYEYIRIENTLKNYRSAALMYYTDHDEWPPAGEYLPDSPMVISLDYYTYKSFDKKKYSHLLIKEIPAGSKRFYIGLRPEIGSPLSSLSIRQYLAERGKLGKLFRADGLPYSSEIIGSGDVFIPMNPSSGKGCL